MITSYELIFKKFLRKLPEDDKFFKYKGLTEQESQELILDHLKDLLEQSIDFLYTLGDPEVDFYDKDDTLEQFNFDLIKQEIGLFSNIMYLMYNKEDFNRLKVMGLTFKNKELEVFSPANDRKTFLDMYNSLESKIINEINNYYSRKRTDWKNKSIYEIDYNV